VEAAALTAMVRHTLRAMSEFVSRPAELLARLDGALKKRGSLSVCTALCLRLEGPRVTVAAGGHPLPLSITADSVDAVGEHGPLLGGLDDVQWRETTVDLEPDSTLVLYTDGVTDAIGEDGARYGTQRLKAALSTPTGGSAASVVERLVNVLAEFQVGPHADDVAVLALRRTASPHESHAAASPRRDAVGASTKAGVDG
jgi:serine phosphatase RsbU (regulator of sigma subunit)